MKGFLATFCIEFAIVVSPVVIAFFLLSCGGTSPEEEIYNIDPTQPFDKDGGSSDAGTQRINVVKYMEDAFKQNVNLTISKPDGSLSVNCSIESGAFVLEEQLDGSMMAFVSAIGRDPEKDVEFETGKRFRQCSLEFYFPWNLDNPVTLPWTWVYNDELLTTAKSASEYYSRYLTSVSISDRTVYDNGGEPEIVLIFPNPADEDPHCATLLGQASVLGGTVITPENVFIKAAAELKMKDHTGVELSVRYSTNLGE